MSSLYQVIHFWTARVTCNSKFQMRLACNACKLQSEPYLLIRSRALSDFLNLDSALCARTSVQPNCVTTVCLSLVAYPHQLIHTRVWIRSSSLRRHEDSVTSINLPSKNLGRQIVTTMSGKRLKTARVLSVIAATVIALACGTNVHMAATSVFLYYTDGMDSMRTRHGHHHLQKN